MYLSHLLLNPRDTRVRRDLADCQELHRTVLSAFPHLPEAPNARETVGALHRVDVHPRTGAATLLVQSRVEPRWDRLPIGYLLEPTETEPNPAVKEVSAAYAALEPGMVLRFRLRANPTRKIDTKSGPDGQRRNGRRVELRGEDAQLAWLKRKAADHGFEIETVRLAPDVLDTRAREEPKAHGFRRDAEGGTRRLTVAVVTFDGRLRIVDADRFRTCLAGGIGSAKAYGFGLLSIGPG